MTQNVVAGIRLTSGPRMMLESLCHHLGSALDLQDRLIFHTDSLSHFPRAMETRNDNANDFGL